MGWWCLFTVLDAPINPPDNKLPGVECLPVADDKKKNKHDIAQIFEICQQIELAIQYIAEKDKTDDIATAFETFASGFEDAISSSCADEYSSQLCRTAEGLLECLEEVFVPLIEEEEEEDSWQTGGNMKWLKYNSDWWIVEALVLFFYFTNESIKFPTIFYILKFYNVILFVYHVIL